MIDESIISDINIHLDVGHLVQEFEAKALSNLFGALSPAQKGMADGSLLDRNQQDRAVIAIKAEFDRQCRRLTETLHERHIELVSEKKRIEESLIYHQNAVQDLEATQGNRLVYQKMMNDLIQEFNRSVVEQTRALEQVSNEYERKLQSIEEELNNELPRQEPLEFSGISAYKKLTALMLKFGSPQRDPKTGAKKRFYLIDPSRNKTSTQDQNGFFEFFTGKLNSIFKKRVEEQQTKFDERITFESAQFRYLLESIVERASYIPSYGRAWFYSLIATLVFTIEIPITYQFTVKSLKIDPQTFIGTAVMCALVFGLPLCIGLAFKIFSIPALKNGIEASRGQQKAIFIRKMLLLFFTVTLIAGIGLLNGIAGLPDFDNIRFAGTTTVFLSITAVLSMVGAHYFDLALQSWSRRLLLRAKGKKIPDLHDRFAGFKKAMAQLIERAILVDRAIEKIQKAVNRDTPGQKSSVEGAFEDAGNSTAQQYTYGFEAGWRGKVHELFRNRKPVPTREIGVENN